MQDSFYNRDLSKPIEITIIFHQLDKNETRIFRRNLNTDGSLRIKQRIWIPSKETIEDSSSSQNENEDNSEGELENVTQEKHGIEIVAVDHVIDWLNLEDIPQIDQVEKWWQTELIIGKINFKEYCESASPPTPEDFKAKVDQLWENERDEIPQIDWLNQIKPTKTDIKKWWQSEIILADIDFKAYFEDRDRIPDPEEFVKAVERFWEDHGDKIPVMRHEASERILGWSNKLKGNLPKLIYIPAIRHIQEEIKIAKTNPYGIMLNWLLGDISKTRKEDLQNRINKAIEEVFTQTQEAEQEQLRIDIIRDTLNKFIQDQFDISIDFEFPPPKLDDLLSGNASIVGDDGFRSSIHEKGQGVQRSIMFSILRTYCEHREKLEGSDKRNNIFAIEEPEVCLHPAIKRATYRLLRRLSEGNDQVFYSTHDGYFVDVRHFDEVRVLRRLKWENGKWETRVWNFPIDHLILDLKNRYNKDATAESIRGNFGRFYDPAKNEGFFAKKVILVEGPTEEYALPIYFRTLGYDLDQEQTAIINAGSVQHLDYLYIVFNELGIPCYVIFDGDKPMIDPFDPSTLNNEQRRDLKEKSKRNKSHLKIFGLPGLVDDASEYFFPPTMVNDRITIFEHEFEVEIHQTLPGYAELKARASAFFGNDSKPLIARYIADQITQTPEHIPALILTILENVRSCSHHGCCLMIGARQPQMAIAER